MFYSRRVTDFSELLVIEESQSGTCLMLSYMTEHCTVLPEHLSGYQTVLLDHHQERENNTFQCCGENSLYITQSFTFGLYLLAACAHTPHTLAWSKGHYLGRLVCVITVCERYSDIFEQSRKKQTHLMNSCCQEEKVEFS